MSNESWHEWRSKGIGSSDAPAVMGVSPWSTAYELWERKTGKVTKDFSNWATDRGNRLEPAARAYIELTTGLAFPATLAVNEQFPFIRASLDGYNAEEGIILEIKCPGKGDHATAQDGKVPDKYWPQLQHQLLATPAAKSAIYFSFDGDSGVRVDVQRDPEYQARLFERLVKFWKCIKDDTPPDLAEKDFKKVRNAELTALLREYWDLKGQVEKIEELKATILNHESVLGRRVQVANWKINLAYRKGNVDYSKIPELRGVDLEPYRKKGTSYRTISETKE
jgi:putative phage-type endonuclease